MTTLPARNMTAMKPPHIRVKNLTCSRLLPPDSDMAENCQASRNIPATSVRRVGILQATAYSPLASLPRKAVIMYLSDTLVIHQNTVVGINGMLYRSI